MAECHPVAVSDARPLVTLPGNGVEINSAAKLLGDCLARQRTHFLYLDEVFRLEIGGPGGLRLRPVKSVGLASDLEAVAQFQRQDARGNLHPATCSPGKAEVILHSQPFRMALPPLRKVSPCPVILERNGKAVVITGYDEASGIYALGDPPPPMTLAEAVKLLRLLLADFQFATQSDRSRALAAILAPALESGRWFHGRIPIDLSQADQSQTGKGFRNQLTAAVYRQRPSIVNQRRGVGSLEDSFQKLLIQGHTIISLDNVRGQMDFQFIESFMTESSVTARAAYTAETSVDTRGVTVMITSNSAQMTKDLANRASCVNLLKHPVGYQFQAFPEGSILQHVQANQPLFLAAVFTVIKEWLDLGKPTTNECRHSFREWAQALDWIVQNIFGEAPLLDGHGEAQQRMTTPYLNWLREVGLEAIRVGRNGELLQASDILDLVTQSGSIEIPGTAGGVDLVSDEAYSAAVKQIGKRIAACFGDDDHLVMDGWEMERVEDKDNKGNRRRRYRISRAGELRVVTGPPATLSIDIQGQEAPPCDDSSDLPLTTPFDKSPVSFDPFDDSQLLQDFDLSPQPGHSISFGVRQPSEGIKGSEGDGPAGREVASVW